MQSKTFIGTVKAVLGAVAVSDLPAPIQDEIAKRLKDADAGENVYVSATAGHHKAVDKFGAPIIGNFVGFVTVERADVYGPNAVAEAVVEPTE